MENRQCIDCVRYKEQADSFPCSRCANLEDKPYYLCRFIEEQEPETLDIETQK